MVDAACVDFGVCLRSQILIPGISIPPKSFVVLFLCHAEALKVPLMIHTVYEYLLEYIPHIMIPVSFNEQHDNVRILQRYATLSRENSS